MEKKSIELDPVAERLMAFVMEQGGPSPVAGRLDKHPQIFYNIREGKSKPSMDTLREIKAVYGPAFDLDWIIMGITTEPAPAGVKQVVPAALALQADLTAVIEAKDDLIKAQADELRAIRQDHADLMRSYLKLAEKGFSSSNSHLTADSFNQNIQRYIEAGVSAVQRIGFILPHEETTPQPARAFTLLDSLNLIRQYGNYFVGPRELKVAA